MDAAAITSRVREKLTEWRRRAADKNQWAEVDTLAELGTVTARWLEGDIQYNWAYNGRPDEETDQLVAPLASANRAGFVTTGSQPGLEEDAWQQRAAVEGLADTATRDRLKVSAESRGLLFASRRSTFRMDYSTAVNVTKTTDPEGNVWEHTGFGSTISRHHLKDLLLGHCPGVHDEACDAWQVTIIDPEWNRNDRLVAALDEFSGRQAPESEEVAVLPQSERAKGVEARTHGWDGKPLSEADKRFFALRDSGYKGPIDQGGNKAPCLICDQSDCTGRRGFEGKCNGAKTKDGRATSTAAQNGGASRTTAGGTMSVDLDVPTATATDASTHETLAQALRETADNARRSAVDKDAQAESLRSQASALADKPDMADSAQALLNEAARLAEVAEARRGMASAYEDKAAQVDAQRAK